MNCARGLLNPSSGILSPVSSPFAAVLAVNTGPNVQVYYTSYGLTTAGSGLATLLATLNNQSIANISQANFSVIL